MTRVADTSALYALFDEDDAHHARARDRLAEPEPVLVPREILVETTNLLQYRFGWSATREAVGSLLDEPHVAVAGPVPVEGVWGAYERAEGVLSLADAVVVQTCRAQDAHPLAFDEAIEGRTPDEADG